MTSIDHLGFSVGDYAKAMSFYGRALAPIGITKLREFEHEGTMIAGFGSERPFFWLSSGHVMGGRVHVCFTAGSREQVDAFHAAALAAGGTDNGGPGIRAHYHENYYAAFVLDPDGHNIEAVCHGPE